MIQGWEPIEILCLLVLISSAFKSMDFYLTPSNWDLGKDNVNSSTSSLLNPSEVNNPSVCLLLILFAMRLLKLVCKAPCEQHPIHPEAFSKVQVKATVCCSHTAVSGQLPDVFGHVLFKTLSIWYLTGSLWDKEKS